MRFLFIILCAFDTQSTHFLRPLLGRSNSLMVPLCNTVRDYCHINGAIHLLFDVLLPIRFSIHIMEYKIWSK